MVNTKVHPKSSNWTPVQIRILECQHGLSTQSLWVDLFTLELLPWNPGPGLPIKKKSIFGENVNKNLIINDNDRLQHYLLKFKQSWIVLRVLKFYFLHVDTTNVSHQQIRHVDKSLVTGSHWQLYLIIVLWFIQYWSNIRMFSSTNPSTL